MENWRSAFPMVMSSIAVGVMIPLLVYVVQIKSSLNELDKLSGMSDKLSAIEERIEDISDIKSGVDKLLGLNGIAKVTPVGTTSLELSSSQIIIPSDSVPEPMWFEFTEYKSFPLPSEELPENYEFLDWGLEWELGELTVGSSAEVGVELYEMGLLEESFGELAVLYRDVPAKTWEGVPVSIDENTAILSFDAKHTGMYILAQKVMP